LLPALEGFPVGDDPFPEIGAGDRFKFDKSMAAYRGVAGLEDGGGAVSWFEDGTSV
jgi:hypothetical protein